MRTLRDLYLRITSAIDGAPASVRADVDTAFADHEAALTAAADQVSTEAKAIEKTVSDAEGAQAGVGGQGDAP